MRVWARCSFNDQLGGGAAPKDGGATVACRLMQKRGLSP